MTYSNEHALMLLPKDWVPLFKYLSVSVERGVMWYREVTSSEYSETPWWFTLLDNLTTHDPIIEDSQLLFRPRYLLLPAVLRERFLKFMLAQSYIVPDGILHELLSALENHIQQNDVGYAHLQKLAAISRYTEKELEQLSDRQERLNNDNADASFKSKQFVMLIDDASDTDEPETKRRKFDDNKEADDTVLITDSPEQCESDEDNSPLPVFTQMNFSQQHFVSFIDEDELELGNNENTGSVIKDTWQNCFNESVRDFFHDLTKISASDMESVLQSLDFVAMSDDTVKLACEHLCMLEESLSYTVVVMFMSRALSPRVKAVDQSASRKLTEAVINSAEKFPKQFIDGVFTSCVGEQELSVGQNEMFCKIIKDCWSQSSRDYALHAALHHGLEVQESNMQLLQTFVEHDCQINDADLQIFVTKLATTSLILAKNLKFSKFLLAFVTHCGQRFSTSLLPDIERIVNTHQTFMKKKIVAALNKHKK